MVGLLIMLFPEVSMTDLKEPWKEVVSRPWADKEDIFILEGRAGIVCLRRVLRTAKGFHRRHLFIFIGDSMSAILAFQKGRHVTLGCSSYAAMWLRFASQVTSSRAGGGWPPSLTQRTRPRESSKEKWR